MAHGSQAVSLMENRTRTPATKNIHLVKSKGTNSPSQDAGWFLRGAPASRQRQIPKQWLPEGRRDTTLSLHGSSHGERQGKSCGCRCVCACGRRKNGSVSFIAPDYSTTLLFPQEPWRMLIHIVQISLFCVFPMTTFCLPITCPVFVIAVGRIQGAKGRSNTANPIFLSLLMLTASPAKPLMEL